MSCARLRPEVPYRVSILRLVVLAFRIGAVRDYAIDRRLDRQ